MPQLTPKLLKETLVPKHTFGWLTGGKFYCSKECAGYSCIPFAFVPVDAKCANREREIDGNA